MKGILRKLRERNVKKEKERRYTINIRRMKSRRLKWKKKTHKRRERRCNKTSPFFILSLCMKI
jgi:hypothetical protein